MERFLIAYKDENCEVLLRNYRVVLVIKPSISSHFQGFEAILCLICFLVLIKCIKKFLVYGDGVCCIQGNKGEWNSRMQYLQLKKKEMLLLNADVLAYKRLLNL